MFQRSSHFFVKLGLNCLKFPSMIIHVIFYVLQNDYDYDLVGGIPTTLKNYGVRQLGL